jgi:hypothetical protein
LEYHNMALKWTRRESGRVGYWRADVGGTILAVGRTLGREHSNGRWYWECSQRRWYARVATRIGYAPTCKAAMAAAEQFAPQATYSWFLETELAQRFQRRPSPRMAITAGMRDAARRLFNR